MGRRYRTAALLLPTAALIAALLSCHEGFLSRGAGAQCDDVAQCRAPFICALGRCRLSCEDTECPGELLCVGSDNGDVCTFVGDDSDACDDVTCAPDQTCSEGECVPEQSASSGGTCAAIVCDEGQQCHNGACVPGDCIIDDDCVDGGTCVGGMCMGGGGGSGPDAGADAGSSDGGAGV